MILRDAAMGTRSPNNRIPFLRRGIFRRTQSWLTNPMPVDILSILAMLGGLIQCPNRPSKTV